MEPWQAERDLQQANAWRPGRQILNAAPAQMPRHHCRIPIRVRVVWADTGTEEWLETTALGWSGDLVYVDMWGTGYGLNACWLKASDVTRR